MRLILVVAVVDRDVLGQDRDAALALEVVGVEDPLSLELRCPILAGLAEHRVDQRRLAVVDVGDDGHVSNVVASLHGFLVRRFEAGLFRGIGPRECSGGVLGPDPSGAMISYPLPTIADKSACHGRMHYGTFDISQFLGILVVMLAVAKVGGFLAQKLGQPAVLGELIGGVLVGKSVLGLVDPEFETIHLALRAGGGDPAVRDRSGDRPGPALEGGCDVAGGRASWGSSCRSRWASRPAVLLGLSTIVSIVAAATLTATSVGITARVLSDLGRLHEPEGQIILGAAVIDDILGLMILTVVVAELTEGRRSRWLSDRADDRERGGLSGGGALGRQRMVVPVLFRWAGRIELPGTATALALDRRVRAGLAGRSVRLGDDHRRLRRRACWSSRLRNRTRSSAGITEIGHFFVPLFFVAVGASVDLNALNPFDPASRFALLIGRVLIVVGVAGKLAAGYAPFWFRGNKTVDRRRHGAARRGRPDLRPGGARLRGLRRRASSAASP